MNSGRKKLVDISFSTKFGMGFSRREQLRRKPPNISNNQHVMIDYNKTFPLSQRH